MADQLPARLRRHEMVPSEDHLRPRGSLHIQFGFFFVLLVSFAIFAIPGMTSIGAAMIVGILGGIVWLGRRNIGSAKENQRGVGLLNVGDIEEAEAIFDRLARRKLSGRNHVVFVYNVGVAALLQGRYRRALSIFNGIDQSGQLRKTYYLRNLEPNLYIEMGCCLALGGQVAEATAQLKRAETILEPPENARLLFLEAVIAVRRGDFQGAVERVDQQWRRAEGTLRGPTLRTLRIVYAFALQQLGQRDSRKFDLMVAGAMPARPEDFDWATREWPELKAFVRDVVVW